MNAPDRLPRPSVTPPVRVSPRPPSRRYPASSPRLRRDGVSPGLAVETGLQLAVNVTVSLGGDRRSGTSGSELPNRLPGT